MYGFEWRNVRAVDRHGPPMFTAQTSNKGVVMRFAAVVLAILALGLNGCAAIAVVDTAISVTSTVVGTTVDVAAGAVDMVAGSSDDDDIDCDDEDNADEDVCKEKAKKKAEAKKDPDQ
ncbi:MAG: hypothetical protein HOP13_02580 [Alphaproteobacteria bacterium]|nr:hypothetical protein [Alphaproteobacteria bacterium]